MSRDSDAFATQPLPLSRGAAAGRWRTLAGSLTFQVLTILVVSRLFLFGANWFTLRAFPRFGYYPAQLPDEFLPGTMWLDGWARWDTAHYVTIALHGYGGAGNLSHDGGLGFFPLFPMMMKGLVAITGLTATEGRLAVAAIVIANVCFAVSVPLFARLVSARFDDEIARLATIFLCISPFSYFFSVGYSESLFLLLALLTFTFADRRWWIAAAIAVALADSSRIVGLALVPSLILLAWYSRVRWRELIAIAVISPLGTLGYFLYTWWKFDDFFGYFTAQGHWGGWNEHVRHYLTLFLLHPRETLLGDPLNLVIVLNVILGIIWLISLPWVWKLLDPGIATFTSLLVLGQGAMTWVSLGRYLLPAIGFYVIAAWFLSKPFWRGWPREIAIVGSTVMLTMLTILFGHGYWVI
ncbi:MAG TPA: mannosyltransferase family protein [Thermomicrobiales bacterium]|nr:mannosyltransferase family protein [Thermomicrobiales bacterium]